MSVGNLKDYGNKGNNFPYQFRNLRALALINKSISEQNIVDPMARDAFGRERVSEPFTLGDYKHIYGIDPNMFTSISGTGGASFVPNESCVTLSVSAIGDKSIIQSKIYHPYMPGKSQFILMSFNFKNNDSCITKKIGYFDQDNGVFLECTNNKGLYFVIRSSVSGLPLDNSILQESWNVDKCNGTGPSGFNLDVTKTQIMFVDLEWLGVGKVRCGFVHEGEFIIAHEFYHDNVLSKVYMSTGSLPVRAEIEFFDPGGIGFCPLFASMDQICATVMSEGGYVEMGQDWSANNGDGVTLASGASAPLFAIKLKDLFKGYKNRMFVRLDQFNILSTKEPLSYSIIKLPNVAALTTAVAWVAVNTNSGIEYNTGATAYTGGEVVASGYVAASASGKESISTNNNPASAKKNYIAQNLDSTDSEIYVVVVKNLGTTNTVVGVATQWREIY